MKNTYKAYRNSQYQEFGTYSHFICFISVFCFASNERERDKGRWREREKWAFLKGSLIFSMSQTEIAPLALATLNMSIYAWLCGQGGLYV